MAKTTEMDDDTTALNLETLILKRKREREEKFY